MRGFSPPFLASLTLLLAACATSPDLSEQVPPPSAYAGFLAHPDRLQPVPGESGAYRWIDSDAKLAQYNQILLERIQVQLASDAQYKAVDPTDLKTLTDYFQQSIVKALGNAYPIITKPGPGVLRVRAT